MAFLANIPQEPMEGPVVDEGFLAKLRQAEILYKNQALKKVNQNETPFGPEGQVTHCPGPIRQFF